jgi:uncharacterized protein (PEP-CTERM system associated)
MRADRKPHAIRLTTLATALAGAAACALLPFPVLGQVAPGIGGIGAAGAPNAPGGTTPIGTGSDPDQRNGIFYGIRASWLISNNLDLQPDSAPDKRHMLLELAPYVQARMNNARGTAFASYTLRMQSRENQFDLNNTLLAFGDFKVTDEMFRVSANASVFDTNVTPFGTSSYDPGTQRTNSTQYRNFEISPYLVGKFDGNGTWNARYRLRYTDTGTLDPFGFAYPSSTSQTATAYARTDLTRRALGASVNGVAYETDYSNGINYTGAEADVLAWWSINRWNLRLAAGMGYAQNERLKNSDGETSGYGPSAAVEWAPDTRTFIRGRWAQRYYGDSADLSATHRAGNWTFGLTYGQGITDGVRSSFGSGNTGGLSSPGTGLFNSGTDLFGRSTTSANNPVAEGLASRNLLFGGATTNTASPSNLSFGSNAFGGLGLINAAIVFYDTATATVGFVGARSAALASIFYNNRKTALTFSSGIYDDLDQRGATLGASWRLDPVRSVSAALRYTHSSSVARASTSDLTSLIASWDWRITPRSTLSVGGRLQRQTGTGTTVGYDEAAVFVSANHRFE